MRVEILSNSIPKEIKGLKGASAEVLFEFVSSMTRSTHKRAVQGIQRGPHSGRFYRSSVSNAMHQASAPGEYPMSDSGRLASSIEFELPKKGDMTPEGIVGTNLMYGKHLELKPSTRGGRPWLSRAFNEATDGAEALLAKIFKRINKKKGGK